MGDTYRFVENEDEADERARSFKTIDPFPSVPRALLSSAEIHDYVRVTAMLSPFDEKSLKSASYEAKPGGKFFIWQSTGNLEETPIEDEKPIVLPANSISFIQTETKFRLPDYIALRFNLRITHVHRGLLLGTGPLIDPGFEGQLLIPLHNLTSDSYSIDTKRGLIWIEFTKTTHGFNPLEPEASKERHFSPFPKDKCNKDANYYFKKANGGDPIRSSIPGIILKNAQDTEEAANAAKEAKKLAETIDKRAYRFGVMGLAAVIIAAVTIVYNSYSIIMDASALNKSLMDSYDGLQNRNYSAMTKLETLEGKLNTIQNHISDEEHEMGLVREEIDKINKLLTREKL